MNETVEVAIQPQGRYVVVRVRGQLSLQTMAAVRHELVELLREASLVVADLSGLRLRHPWCVAVFLAALQQAGGWPHAKLALFGADPGMLAQLRRPWIRAAVPMADGLEAALAAVARPPAHARPSGIIATGGQGIFHRLVAAEKNEGLAWFAREWLGVLLDYDSLLGSKLVRTLSVYLDGGGDYDEASRALGIHRSTVRYRIERVRELTRLDLNDPETWLNLHAATRALALLTATQDDDLGGDSRH